MPAPLTRRRSSAAIRRSATRAPVSEPDDGFAPLSGSVPAVPLLQPRPAKGLKLLAAAAWQFPPFDSLHVDPASIGRGSCAATIPGASAAHAQHDAEEAARRQQPLHKSSQSKPVASAIFADSADLNVRGAAAPSSLYSRLHVVNPGNAFVVLEIVFAFWQLQSIVLTTPASKAVPDTIRLRVGRLAGIFALDLSAFVPDTVTDTNPEAVEYIFDASCLLALVVVVAGLLVLRRAAARAAAMRDRLDVCEYAMRRSWAHDDAALRATLRASLFAVLIGFVPLLRCSAEVALCGSRYFDAYGEECGAMYKRVLGGVVGAVLCPVVIAAVFAVTTANKRMFAQRFTRTGGPNDGAGRDYMASLERAVRLNPGAVFVSETKPTWLPHRVLTLVFAFLFVVTAVIFSAVSRAEDASGSSGTAGSNTTSTGDSTTVDGVTVPFAIKSAFALLLVLQLIFAGAVAFLRPYTSAHATALDVLTQLFGVGCTASVTVAVYGADGSVASIFYGIFCGGAVLLAIVGLAFTSRSTRESTRARLGQLRLTPVSDGDPTPLAFAPHRIDFAKERRERVWQPYWTALLTAVDPLRPSVPAPEIEIEDGDIERKRDVSSDNLALRRAQALGKHFDCFIGLGRPACLLGFSGSAGERHIENMEAAASIGAAELAAATAEPMSKAEADAVLVAVRLLHGPDCFVPDDILSWSAAVDTAAATSASMHHAASSARRQSKAGEPKKQSTAPPKRHVAVGPKGRRSAGGGDHRGRFGCLYVIPCPLAFYFKPDRPVVGHVDGGANGDDDDAEPVEDLPVEVSLDVSDIPAIVAANGERDVMRRRVAREKLRAIALMCAEENYVCDFVHREFVAASSVGVTTASGDALVSYERGVLSVSADTGTPVFDPNTSGLHFAPNAAGADRDRLPRTPIVPGFTVSLQFLEGIVEERREHTVDGRTVGHGELGITAQFTDTTELRWLIDANKSAVDTGLERWRQRLEAFRLHFAAEFAAKTTALSTAFWSRVAANDHISRDALRKHLARYEANPALKQLALREFDPLVEDLYWRLDFFDTCPALAVWCVFWHDLYTLNKEAPAIADNPHAREGLDPRNCDGISWTICAKADANAWLCEVGLQEAGSGGGVVSRAMVDQLYDAMSKAMCDENSQHVGAARSKQSDARKADKRSEKATTPPPKNKKGAYLPRKAGGDAKSSREDGGGNAHGHGIVDMVSHHASLVSTPPDLTEPLQSRTFIEAAVLPVTDEHRYHHPITRLAPWAGECFFVDSLGPFDAVVAGSAAADHPLRGVGSGSHTLADSSNAGKAWTRESILREETAARILDRFPVLKWALEGHLLNDEGTQANLESLSGSTGAAGGPRGRRRTIDVVTGAQPPRISPQKKADTSAIPRGPAALPAWASPQGGGNAFIQPSAGVGRAKGSVSPRFAAAGPASLHRQAPQMSPSTSPAAAPLTPPAAPHASGRGGVAASGGPDSFSNSALALDAVDLGGAQTPRTGRSTTATPPSAQPRPPTPPAAATLSSSVTSTLSFRGRSPTPSDEAWPEDNDEHADGGLMSV